MEYSKHHPFYTDEESPLLANNEEQLDQAEYEDAKYAQRYPLQGPRSLSMVNGSILQSSSSDTGKQNGNLDFVLWDNFNTGVHDSSDYKSPQHTDTLYPSTLLSLSQRFPQQYQPLPMLLSKDGNGKQLKHCAPEISPFQKEDIYDAVPPLVTGKMSRNTRRLQNGLPNRCRSAIQGGVYGSELQAAAIKGNKEVVELLVNKGADVNAQGGRHGNALYAAARYGHKEAVELLVNKGADVNAQGGGHGNALYAAAIYGNKEVVELLVNKGADVNAQGGFYGNALQAAAAQGNNKEVVELLVNKGADVNAQGRRHGNALHAAAAQGNNKEVVELLVNKGADVNAQGGRHGNALQAAAAQGNNKEVVELLVNKGADVNAQGGGHGNALQAAARYGHKEVVELLVNKGADVNAQGGRHSNALYAAARYGHKEVVELLVNKGADVNAQGGIYGNALQVAVSHGHEEVVKLLVDKGAIVNAEEHALILTTQSSAPLLQPRSASSEIIDGESQGPKSIRQPGLLHPKGDDVEDVASYSDHSADSNENGIADEKVKVENVDEAGFMTETESDIESDEDGQTYEDNVDRILAMALVGVKCILLRELTNCSLIMTTDGSASSSAQSSSPRSRNSTDASISLAPVQPQGQKRTQGDDRDPGDGADESDSNDDDRPKKKHQKHLPNRPAHRRLKCPFYQREPEKYARAACRGEGFADMAKLKDHIKRVHTQPLRCSRCWKEMKSDEEYMGHLQKETICKKLPEPPDDRIRPQMLKRLDFKKAPYAHAKNIEEKWKMLYSVLFPTDTDLPSPYDQHGMSPHFERVLYEALEEELTKELAPALAPILRMIKERLPTIIENCRLRLKRMPPDMKTVYAPSSSISALHSSVGELISQNPGLESDAISRHSEGSMVGFTSFEECHSKAFGNPPLHSASSSSRSSSKDLQKSYHDSSPRSSLQSSMLSSDTTSDLRYDINGNCADLSTRDFNALFAVPCSLPGGGVDITNATDKSMNLSKALGKQPQRKLSKNWEEGVPYSSLQATTLSQYLNSDVSWDDVTTLEPQGKQSQNNVIEGDPLISTFDWNFNPEDLDLSQF